MVTGILALLTALFAAIPMILNLIEGHKANEKKKADALAQRSLSELDAGLNRVFGPPPMQP